MSPASFASSAAATLTGFLARAAGASARGLGAVALALGGDAAFAASPDDLPRSTSAPTATIPITAIEPTTRPADIFMGHPPHDPARSKIPTAARGFPGTDAVLRWHRAKSAAAEIGRTCRPATPPSSGRRPL